MLWRSMPLLDDEWILGGKYKNWILVFGARISKSSGFMQTRETIKGSRGEAKANDSMD